MYCFREARQISLSKNIEDAVPNFGSIQLLKCNCSGTKVAFVSQNVIFVLLMNFFGIICNWIKNDLLIRLTSYILLI